LEIDFGAIDFTTPHMALSSSIGNGLDFTTRILTSRLSESSHFENPLLDYLLSLNHQGEVIIAIRVSSIEMFTNEKTMKVNFENKNCILFLLYCRIL
jgi:hypothetical protein